MIRILYFGPVAEQVGTHDMQIEYKQGICLQDVVVQLQTVYPKAFEIVCFMAVNEQQTRDMQLVLADNDEIAFMAKFSGG
jgi:molybdopterin synthase sulfur carrier subunit